MSLNGKKGHGDDVGADRGRYLYRALVEGRDLTKAQFDVLREVSEFLAIEGPTMPYEIARIVATAEMQFFGSVLIRQQEILFPRDGPLTPKAMKDVNALLLQASDRFYKALRGLQMADRTIAWHEARMAQRPESDKILDLAQWVQDRQVERMDEASENDGSERE